jgi:hypothetical protein
MWIEDGSHLGLDVSPAGTVTLRRRREEADSLTSPALAA